MADMMDPSDDPNNPRGDVKFTFEEMVAQLAKPGDTILSELTALDCHLLHMAVGISGEVAELSIAVTKENILEELGDIEFYLEGLRQGISITDMDVISTSSNFTYGETLVSIAGDILDQIKKRVIYRKPLHLLELTRRIGAFEKVLHRRRVEGGDLTRDMCVAANMEKLGKRYKGYNYNDNAAQQRADKED